MNNEIEFEPHLKSRRLTYYDFDKGGTKSRTFSAIEIEHTNKVFDTIEDILLENDLGIRYNNEWVSSGRCQCQKHDDTYFMIEVNTDILEMDVIHDIEEALEDIKDVELVVLSRDMKDERISYN